MAELSENDRIEIEVVTKIVTSELELDRQENQTVREIRGREDKYTLWIVGLSAGAIAGLSISSRLAVVPQWQAEVVFALFVISIVSGALHNWFNKELQAKDDLYHHVKQTDLIAVLSLLLPGIQFQDDIDVAKARLKAIKQHRDPKLRQHIKNADVYYRGAKFVYYVPPVAFILGVIALAVVASINWPNTPPADITPKQLPQLR